MELIGATVCAAFVKAQKQFKHAIKDSTNPHFRSKYADLSAVLDAVLEALSANDLALSQPLTYENGLYMISTRLFHSSGEHLLLGSMPVPIMPGDGTNPQKVGSAITYARRYHLASSLAISQEDDDGNSASPPPQQPQRPAYQQQPQQRPAQAPPQQRAPQQPASPQAIDRIYGLVDELTKGYSPVQRTKFLHDNLGVIDIEELKRAGPEYVSKCFDHLTELRGENQVMKTLKSIK